MYVMDVAIVINTIKNLLALVSLSKNIYTKVIILFDKPFFLDMYIVSLCPMK